MRRDWIWGWIAALPATIVAFLAIRLTGFFSESSYIAAGTALAFATTIATGVLWIKNRHSIRKIIRAGGDVELVVRPFDALDRSAIVFVIFLGTLEVARTSDQGQVVAEWSMGILVIGLAFYLWSLRGTAYKKTE